MADGWRSPCVSENKRRYTTGHSGGIQRRFHHYTTFYHLFLFDDTPTKNLSWQVNVVNLYFFPGIPLRAGWIARIRCDDMSSHLDILFILVILAFTAQALILSTRLFLKKQKSKWPIRPRNLQLHFSSSKICVTTQGNHSKDLKIISSNCTSQFFDCFSQNAFIRNLLVIISFFFWVYYLAESVVAATCHFFRSPIQGVVGWAQTWCSRNRELRNDGDSLGFWWDHWITSLGGIKNDANIW